MKTSLRNSFIILSFCSLFLNAQEQDKSLRTGLGTSLFNLNESFDNLFFYNNSSPIFVSLMYKNKYRFETILNLSIINNKEERILKSRGSITLGFDYLKSVHDQIKIYFGPKIGYNTNETKLLNAHIGGEYFFHNNWSISNELGLNYLIDYQDYIQTTSSVILRFYL